MIRRLYKGARWVLDWIPWLAIALFSIATSVSYHLQIEAARAVAANTTSEWVTGEILGGLSIGRIEHIDLGSLVARDVSFFDPEGNEVIVGDRVTLAFDYSALFDGTLRFSHGAVEGGELRLISNADGIPSFIDGFSTPGPPSDEPTIHTVIDEMRVSGIRVTGEVLGLREIVVEDASAHMRMTIDGQAEHGFRLQIFDASGRLVSPFEYEATIERVAGEIRDDPELGTEIWTRASSEHGDLVTALIKYRTPRGGDGDELDLVAHADPIDAQRLVDSGFDWASSFQGSLRGHFRLFGPPRELRFNSWLATDAGPIGVSGHMPSNGPVEVAVRAEDTRLDRIMPQLPELTVGGDLRLTTHESGETHFDGRLDPFEYGGARVPPLRVRGEVREDGFALEDVQISDRGINASASGFVGNEGSINLRTRGRIREISADPNGRRFAPGLRGDAHFDMQINSGPGFVDPRIRGRWVFHDFRYGPTHIETLTAEGSISGELSRPDLDLDVNANAVHVNGIALGSGPASLRGPGGTYAASADLHRAGTRIAVHGSVMPFGVIRVELPEVTVETNGNRWRGSIHNLNYASRATDIGRIFLQARDSSIEIQGRYDEVGEDRLVASARGLNLADLKPWFNQALAEVDGTVDLDLETQGDLTGVPSIEIDGQISDGRLGPIDDVGGSVLISYRPDEEGHARLEADGRLETETHGAVDIDIDGLLDTTLIPSDSLLYGAYTAKAETENLDIEFFEGLLGDLELPKVRGIANGHIEAQGSPVVFDFDGEVDIPALHVEGWPVLGVESRIAFEAGGLIGRVELRDDAGDLLELEGSTSLDLASLLAEPSLFREVVQTIPWRAAARMPQRGLGTLPDPIQQMVSGLDNFRGSAHLTASGGAFETRADLIAQLEWIGDLDFTHCGSSARPRAHIDAQLRNGATQATVDGFLGGTRALHIVAEAPTPIELWLQDSEHFQLPPTALEVFLERAPLHQVPVACEYVAGPASAHLVVEKLFTDHPRAELGVSSDEVYARRLRTVRGPAGPQIEEAQRTPPFSVRVLSMLSSDQLTSDADFHWWNGGETRIRGEAPLAWGDGNTLPDFDLDGLLSANASFFVAPVDALLFWLPSLGHVEGTLDGEVIASGSLNDPDLRGELELRDGHVELRALGQRLDEVSGTMLFEGDVITFQGLQALDADGIVRIAGDAQLDGFAPRRLNLRLDADDFPFRQEGSTIATITGASRFDAEVADGNMRGEITVERLRVQLPEDLGRTPQELADHPDVRLAGAEAREVIDDPYVVRLHIDGSRPFSVSAQSYRAEVSALVDVLYIDSTPSVFTIDGDVDIRSGLLRMYGKEFIVRTGSMHFEHRDELDPTVNLLAVHALRSRPGDTITVQATGRLSNPRITFRSSVTNDQSQILAMLVSGQVNEGSFDEANQQTQAFLLGVVSSLATLTLREKIGAAGVLVPEVTIDENQVKMAYTFDDLLPEALRQVVTSIHIEGFYNHGQTQAGAVSTGNGALDRAGVLIELSFPRNIVFTTTLRQTSQSADLTWQP